MTPSTGSKQLADGHCVLKVRVRAAASEGEANAALLRLLARTLGVAPRSVTLVARRHRADQAPHVAGASLALIAALEKIAPIG